MSEKKMKNDKLDYDHPDVSDEDKEIIEKLRGMMGGSNVIEEKDIWYVALEMYKTDPKHLPIISDLDKEHIENLTKFDTWIKSAMVLFDMPENDPSFDIVRTMRDRYLMYSISRNRKSRGEIVSILSQQIQALRTIGDKLVGRR